MEPENAPLKEEGNRSINRNHQFYPILKGSKCSLLSGGCLLAILRVSDLFGMVKFHDPNSKVNRDLQPLGIFEGDVHSITWQLLLVLVTFFTDSYHGIHFRIWEMIFKHLGSKSKVF